MPLALIESTAESCLEIKYLKQAILKSKPFPISLDFLPVVSGSWDVLNLHQGCKCRLNYKHKIRVCSPLISLANCYAPPLTIWCERQLAFPKMKFLHCRHEIALAVPVQVSIINLKASLGFLLKLIMWVILQFGNPTPGTYLRELLMCVCQETYMDAPSSFVHSRTKQPKDINDMDMNWTLY